MNCRRFQNLFYEYVEGTLSPRARAAADTHLARCSACREAVRREQSLSHSLSRQLRQTAAPLTLSPDFRQRLLSSLEPKPAPRAHENFLVQLWQRFAWPLSFAACLLTGGLLLLAFYQGPFLSRHMDPTQRAGIHSPVAIQVSYPMPIYTFRKEGNFVIDHLAYHTNVMEVRLFAHEPGPGWKTQARKTPL